MRVPSLSTKDLKAFAGFRNSAIQTGSTKFVAKLNVPAGSYAITAKLGAFSNNNDSYVEICTLSASGDFDRSFTRLTGSGAEQGLSHHVVHTFPSAGTIQLECVGTSPQASTLPEFIKITATEVNSISNGPLS
jgi:hypothetical protein